MRNPDLKQWINDIISTDAMTFEHAYWGVRPSTGQVVPELIKLLDVHKDLYTRGKLIELLGECEDTSVIPVLINELQNQDEGIRNWAKGSIEALKKGEKWQQDINQL